MEDLVSRHDTRRKAGGEPTRRRAIDVLAHGAALAVGMTLLVSACGSSSPTEPQHEKPPTEVSGLISFTGAGPDRAPIATYSEGPFVVTFRSPTWVVWAGFGNPQPSPVFISPADTNVTGEVQITAPGAVFALRSVDLYSSVTPIPYVIVGTRQGGKEIEIGSTLPAGQVGNTLGNFRTVTNPSTGRLVDSLTITLTNPAVFGGNPMGLDNIVLGR